MMRHVEIEDVAGRGNVEAARGDVGGHQQRNFALAELIEGGGARRLLHVAVQGADGKAVLLDARPGCVVVAGHNLFKLAPLMGERVAATHRVTERTLTVGKEANLSEAH